MTRSFSLQLLQKGPSLLLGNFFRKPNHFPPERHFLTLLKEGRILIKNINSPYTAAEKFLNELSNPNQIQPPSDETISNTASIKAKL